MSAFKFSKSSKRNMKGVDPRLIEIAQEAIKITRIDFGIPRDGGVRTAARQNELFRDGKSKCDGYEKKSNHQPDKRDGLGKALDFYAIDPRTGKATWEDLPLVLVALAFTQAAAALGYKLASGGLWKRFKDLPHVELMD
jgi:peptidoglycan L-alanyl-D-glutamate endopeptidase CwlK